MLSGRLVQKAFHNTFVGIDAAIAQERPPAAYVFRAFQVHFHNQIFRSVVAGLCQKFALRSCYETVSPEQDAVGLSRRVGFVAYTVYGYYRQSVGYGVSALRDDPGSQLACLFIVRISAFPADGGGLDQDFSSSQCHESGCFGIPLVPAYQYA